MKVGILVTSEGRMGVLEGLVEALCGRSHDVTVFIMDEGTRLLGRSELSALCTRYPIRVSYCDYNAKKLGVDTSGLPQEIVCGSQYQNSRMFHDSEKVIVL